MPPTKRRVAKTIPALQAPLLAEKQSRITRTRALKVVDHAKFGGPEKTGFGSPGSVILFLGRSSKETRQALAALKKGPVAMQKLLKRISDEMDALKPGTPADVLDAAKKEPVLAALNYGGVPLADPIWLPKGLEMTVVAAPYTGGHLIPQGFQLIEWVKKDDAPAYAAFVLKTSPPLTRAEKVALKRVPKSHRTVHIGSAYKCEATAVAALSFGVAGAVGGAAAGAAAGGVIGGVVGGVAGAIGGAIVGAAVDAGVVAALEGKQFGKHLHLSGDDIKREGPARSAKRLIEKRRQAMRRAQKARHRLHG